MDLLSKLVGGGGASPSAKQAGFNSPQQRSFRFKKLHEQLQQIWRRNVFTKQQLPAETVLICMESIKNILQDEVQTPEPHLCARYVSTFEVYTIVAQVATAYSDERIMHETLDIFKILTDSVEQEFLERKGFADALIGFISKISTNGPLMVSLDTEGKIVEVLFGIASKLRLQPKLLPAWFRVVAQTLDGTERQDLTKLYMKKENEVFPLFYLTLDYVHHDGRIGDFARTGLLYLVESASHSEPLERWIVESDLAMLMSSGLGALYSQLSRKLVMSFKKDMIPAILTFSESPQPHTPSDAEETTTPEFQAHLATFLSYLVFWQDVLEHCGSDDVKQSLLDHFKFLFLQQLLYPSLMESSDIDGGSSVAVLTYLRCIIESIDNPGMMHMTLQYLLALPDCPEDEQKPARPTTLARRRKSQTLISTLAQGQEKPMPDLFNLVDLVLTSLQSRNQQTVTATLRLIAVILRNQHQYAISSLIKVQICEDLPLRTLDAHHRDTAILFTFAEALIEHDDLGVSYEAHLQDAQVLLETHCCSSRLLDLPGSTMAADTAITSAANSNHHGLVPAHFIRYDDRLMKALVLLLNDFFANDIGTNLGLTQTFATLASCGKTRLDCWLLREPSKFTRLSEYTSSSDCRPDGSAHDGIITLGNCGPGCQNTGVKEKYSDVETISQTPYSVSNAISPVFSALDSLVKQVEIFRREVQDFDTYLAERRHIFKVGEDIDKDGIEDSGPSRRSGDPSTQSKSRNVAKIGSISERLMSETSSANISRSSSPRGRQLNETPASKLVGHLNQLLVSPSTSPSKMAGRASSPSPLRRDPVVPMSPKRLVTPMGPGDALRQKVKVETVSCNNKNHACDLGSSETSSIRSGSALPEQETQDRREVTLSHLLTNIIILQEFILEIASIMQVRASLFGEVKLG